MGVVGGIVLELMGLIFAIINFLTGIRKDEKKGRWIHIISGIAGAVISFGIAITQVELEPPQITRAEDFSSIILTSRNGYHIKYQIGEGKKEKWMTYREPFTVEHNTVIRAKACMLNFDSEEVYRDVYVEENGLMDFGGADVPRESLKNLKAAYIYKEPQNGQAGNSYTGYEISPKDIQVTGTDLDGNSVTVTEFSYTPQILSNGKNAIEVSYALPNGKNVTTHFWVEAHNPQLLSIRARYKGSTLFAGTELSIENLEVTGGYEDGTQNEITGFTLSTTKIKTGMNVIKITKDGVSTELSLNAVEKDSITEKEIEPNDDISTANDIETNVKYTGMLRKEDDVDFYKVQLNKKGKITLRFKHPKIDSDYLFWNVYLMGMDETEKIRMDVSGEAAECVSNGIRVASGVYYIKVASSSFSDEKYVLTVEFQEEGDEYETEPNNDLTQARVIKTNKVYTGNLQDSYDVDCYSFRLKGKRKVHLQFSHAKMNSDYNFWKVALLGESDGSLTEIYSNGLTAKQNSDCVRLPAGNYYVRISSNSWSAIDYSIKVVAEEEKIETENEENDDFGLATTISLGKTIVGNIQSDNDVDFYRFVLKKRTNVKITFTHNPIDNYYTFWVVTLYSEESGGGLTSDNGGANICITGDSSKNNSETWSLLPAGMYYIRVTDSSYNNDDYKLKVSSY